MRKWAFRIRIAVAFGLGGMYLVGISLSDSDIDKVAFFTLTAGTCLIVGILAQLPIPHDVQDEKRELRKLMEQTVPVAIAAIAAGSAGFAGELSHRWAFIDVGFPLFASGLIIVALIARALDTRAAQPD